MNTLEGISLVVGIWIALSVSKFFNNELPIPVSVTTKVAVALALFALFLLVIYIAEVILLKIKLPEMD